MPTVVALASVALIYSTEESELLIESDGGARILEGYTRSLIEGKRFFERQKGLVEIRIEQKVKSHKSGQEIVAAQRAIVAEQHASAEKFAQQMQPLVDEAMERIHSEHRRMRPTNESNEQEMAKAYRRRADALEQSIADKKLAEIYDQNYLQELQSLMTIKDAIDKKLGNIQ